MRSSATTVIASAALVLAGCAVGILLGRWTSSSAAVERTPAESSAPSQDLAPILAQLQRINETLLKAPREREETAQRTANPREATAPHPDVVDRLAAAVEKLDAVLEGTGGRIGVRKTGLENWKAPGYPSLEVLWQRVDAVTDGNGQSDLTPPHLAWSREDLFERYGAPSALAGVPGGIMLTYRRPPNANKPTLVSFLVTGDLVTNVYCQ